MLTIILHHSCQVPFVSIMITIPTREALAVIGLVSNIVQFVDFSARLLSDAAQLYNSAGYTLLETANIETATNHLVLLNDKLKFDAARPKTMNFKGFVGHAKAWR